MLNMKIARLKKGLNQSELAELVGVQSKIISRYETGVNYPTVDTLLKISEALNVSVDYLLGITDKER